MINAMWGGLESNQVGTAEFVDFARKVHAEPLMCVNFESDGRPQYKTVKGKDRCGDAREAANWVAYCNDPDNAERRGHGLAEPIPIRYWQLGNETSYDNHGFDRATAVGKTIEFAKAMRDAPDAAELGVFTLQRPNRKKKFVICEHSPRDATRVFTIPAAEYRNRARELLQKYAQTRP